MVISLHPIAMPACSLWYVLNPSNPPPYQNFNGRVSQETKNKIKKIICFLYFSSCFTTQLHKSAMIILKSLLIASILYPIAKADTASARAASLNITQTWNAPIPSSSTATSSAVDYITQNWFKSSKSLYGANDVSFVQDPFAANGTDNVVKVLYPAGSYAPVGTKNDNTGTTGGLEFYSVPDDGTYYNTALLSYDLAFDPGFDWVKGGKLPGIFGGM